MSDNRENLTEEDFLYVKPRNLSNSDGVLLAIPDSFFDFIRTMPVGEGQAIKVDIYYRDGCIQVHPHIA